MRYHQFKILFEAEKDQIATDLSVIKKEIGTVSK